MKNNQDKEADMEGNPSGRAKTIDNFIIVAGGIPAGTKMESEEVDRHPHYQQQGGNPLQEPRPKTTFFYVHYFLPQSTPRIRKIISHSKAPAFKIFTIIASVILLSLFSFPASAPSATSAVNGYIFLYRFIKSSFVKTASKGMFFLSIFSRPPSWRSTRAMAFITFRLDSLARSIASIVD